MKEIIKQIRLQAKMSQEQFASALGTTTVSINRWENGKSLPNQIAQNNLFRFCNENQINAFDSITASYISLELSTSNSVVLYHGSKNGIHGVIAPISRCECDFGAGFYMGTIPIQPLTLICAEEKPYFYTLKMDLSGLKILNLDLGIEWALLIAFNRKQMEQAADSAVYRHYAHLLDGYDVVIGHIANDRMYTELGRFFNGSITDTALLKCLSALDLGKQYVALTKKACDNIEVIDERSLRLFDRLVLQEESNKRRTQGIKMADKIVKVYRREGKYFDEIIGGDFS